MRITCKPVVIHVDVIEIDLINDSARLSVKCGKRPVYTVNVRRGDSLDIDVGITHLDMEMTMNEV